MDENPNQIPARTTPTWELELLISGATVFSLLQVPGKLSELFTAWLNSADPAVAGLVLPLGIYLQFAALMLAMTFVLHLFLRGYWVALVGLNSVYPEGIRWDRLKLGRYYEEATRRAMGTVGDRIESADNRATRVFAVGFGIAMAMLVPIVVVALVLASIYAAEWAGADPRLAQTVFWLVFVLLVGPFFLALAVDRRMGPRLAPDSRLARGLRHTLHPYVRFGLSRSGNPLLAIYMSQMGRRKASLVVTGLMLPGMLFAIAMLIGNRFDVAGVSFVGLAPLRSDGAFRVDPARYDSLRGEASLDPQPYIADPVVSGPYLRLFIPYLPRRHNPALQRRCPAAVAAAQAGEPEAALACLAQLHAPSVDGKALDVAFLATSDAKTRQRGMLAMIPVNALPEGRHDLTLRPVARSERPDEIPAVIHIPFWK